MKSQGRTVVVLARIQECRGALWSAKNVLFLAQCAGDISSTKLVNFVNIYQAVPLQSVYFYVH